MNEKDELKMNFWIPLVLTGLIIVGATYVDAVMNGAFDRRED
jgi:hypothetical protein